MSKGQFLCAELTGEMERKRFNTVHCTERRAPNTVNATADVDVDWLIQSLPKLAMSGLMDVL